MKIQLLKKYVCLRVVLREKFKHFINDKILAINDGLVRKKVPKGTSEYQAAWIVDSESVIIFTITSFLKFDYY